MARVLFLAAALAACSTAAGAGDGAASDRIDELLAASTKDASLTPAPLIDDTAYLRRATIDLVGRRRVAPTPPPPPPSRELRESPGKEERTNVASASSSASWLADPSRGSRSGFADASRPGTSSGGCPGPPRPPPPSPP